jgi:hypothetical protein
VRVSETSTWTSPAGSFFEDAVSTADGGFIAVGNGPADSSIGGSSMSLRVTKFTATGDLSWTEGFAQPGTGSEGTQVIQTADGGYLALAINYGIANRGLWAVKLATDGSVQWNKVYSIPNTFADASRVEQVAGGGFLVVANLTPNNGSSDVWLLRLNADGAVVSQKTYGTPGGDRTYAARALPGGGEMVLTRHSTSTTTAASFFSLSKINDDGSVGLQKAFAGPSAQSAVDARDVELTSDGGYVVEAAYSPDGTTGWTAALIKLDSLGSIQWQKAFEGIAGAGGIVAGLDGIATFGDGSIVVSGNGVHTSPSDAYGPPFMAALNADGTLRWSQTYNFSSGLPAASFSGVATKARDGALFMWGDGYCTAAPCAGNTLNTLMKVSPKDGALAPISSAFTLTLGAAGITPTTAPVLSIADTTAVTSSVVYAIDTQTYTDTVTHLASSP